MALYLKLKPRALNLTPFRSTVVAFSSDVPPPPESNYEGGATDENEPAGGTPESSYSSYFTDIKERLKSHPAPPRRIPLDPPLPPSLSSPSTGASPAASFDEIRKHLAEFRHRTTATSDRTTLRPQSQQSTISFQELFKNNVLNRPSDVGGVSLPTSPDKDGRLSFEAIREKLRQIPKSTREQPGPRTTPFNLRSFQDTVQPDTEKTTTSILGFDVLPDQIFGREKREKEERKGESGKELKTEFLKTYSYDELGEKLRKLRLQAAEKDDEGFSLLELNERLVKLRELEEKERESGMSGVFRDLRESLVKLKDAEASKKSNSVQGMSIISSFSGQVTPTFMLNPPQEHFLERYFHPDHMSSAEKMKLELRKVRDEFKMSESDCGSARVQVAQLTTKIKHLASVLHKKDKHSRKGLVDMVQKRKKLLKYLRRTDWDSYCLVLSKLGLRDVPEYKAPHYKT